MRKEALARNEDPDEAARKFNEKIVHGDFKAAKEASKSDSQVKG